MSAVELANNSKGFEMECVITKNFIGSNVKTKIAIVDFDIREDVEKMPSMSFDGMDYYFSASRITSSQRKTNWYKNAKQAGPLQADFRCWCDRDSDSNEWEIQR